jgi:hypothetical protein
MSKQKSIEHEQLNKFVGRWNTEGKILMNDFATAIDKIPKIVFSLTLKNVDWKSATLAKRDLKETVLELKQ